MVSSMTFVMTVVVVVEEEEEEPPADSKVEEEDNDLQERNYRKLEKSSRDTVMSPRGS